MTSIGAFVAAVHNAWLALPLWARTGIGAIVAAVVALALAFGWTVPHSLADVQVQAVAFFVLVVPTVVSIFKSSLLPGIVTWYLRTFGYAPAYKVQRAASRAGLKRRDIWVRA